MESNLAHVPDYWGLAIFFFAPSAYFLVKEFFYMMDGYKFCLNKGITIGLVPGIGHMAAVSDFFCLFAKCEKHGERSKDSCR